MINGGRKVLSGKAIIKSKYEWQIHAQSICIDVNTMIFKLNGEIKTISKINLSSNTIRVTTLTIKQCQLALRTYGYHKHQCRIEKMCWIVIYDQSKGGRNNISNFCWYDQCRKTNPLFSEKELLQRKTLKRKAKEDKKQRKSIKKNNKYKVVCRGCKTAAYCCRKHQKMDWIDGHKTLCVNGRLSKYDDFYSLYYIGLHCFN